MSWNAVSAGEWLLAFRGILMPSSSRVFDPRSWRHMPEDFAPFTCSVLPKWVTSPLWTQPSSVRATLNVDGHKVASSNKIRFCSDEDCLKTGASTGMRCNLSLCFVRQCNHSAVRKLLLNLRALRHAMNQLCCAS